MVERGADYAIQPAPDGDRGWVFCPEYAGPEPLEISPAGWDTRIFLFGPGRLPDTDFRFGDGPDRPDTKGARRRASWRRTVESGFPPSTPYRYRQSMKGKVASARKPSRTARKGHQAPGDPPRPQIQTAETGKRPTAMAVPPTAQRIQKVPQGAPAARLSRTATARLTSRRQSPPSRWAWTASPSADVRWPLTIKGNPHLLIAGLPGYGEDDLPAERVAGRW